MCDIEYINELFEKAEMEEEGYVWDWDDDWFEADRRPEMQDVYTPWAMGFV